MRTEDSSHKPIIKLDPASALKLVYAAWDDNHIGGYTHNFYRYPARFSPTLVRAMIDAFTAPGDVVLDPFVGGGTTLVEALAAGRRAIGADISELAAFVSDVKTTVYSEGQLASLRQWADQVGSCIDMRAAAKPHTSYEEAGYLRHLSRRRTWRLRKAIAQALSSVTGLCDDGMEKFARCSVLRAAQWALDGRKVLPTIGEFRGKLREYVYDMTAGSAELAQAAAAYRGVSAVCLCRPTSGLEHEAIFENGQRPRLVITSPPYPGVHVLYHRWQIHGGKETPAPFWIANRLDGDGAAYYTMGDRHTHASGTYFNELRAALQSIARVCDKDTIVVQVVAFSDPVSQLSRYLSVADDVGFEEHLLETMAGTNASRLWRSVPNRKWYASQKGSTAGSSEVVLFHKLRSGAYAATSAPSSARGASST